MGLFPTIIACMDASACKDAVAAFIAAYKGPLAFCSDNEQCSASPLTPNVLIQCHDSSTSSSSPIADAHARQEHARAFFFQPPADSPQIHILHPNIPDAAALQRVLTHEATHAHDALVHGWDLRMLGALACSEIRAAAAAECADMWPDWRRRGCTRDAASSSTAMVFPVEGRSAVTTVFSWCYDSTLADDPVRHGPLADVLTAEAGAVAQLPTAPR